MQNSEYKIVSKNCAELMRNALEQFLESESKDRRRSRPITVFTRMKKTLDPAWVEYSKIVDTNTPFDQLIQGFSPSEYAKEFGFLTLEDWCIHTIRKIGCIQEVPKNKAILELIDTIAELRSLAIWCGRNKAKFKPVARNNQSRNFNLQNAPLHCRVCNSATELRTFAEEPSMWVNDDFAVKRPSKIYCADHRPVQPNSSGANPAYQKFLRKKKLIEVEFERLHRQSYDSHKPNAKSGNALVDEFSRLIVQSNFLYPGDDQLFQQLAVKIVSTHVNDNKKKIVVALRAGKTQIEVAKLMGKSQQAISKAIAKIPKEFRFDQIN